MSSEFFVIYDVGNDSDISNDTQKCSEYIIKSKNVTYLITGEYEGIPDNIIMNVAAWLVSIYKFLYYIIIGN